MLCLLRDLINIASQRVPIYHIQVETITSSRENGCHLLSALPDDSLGEFQEILRSRNPKSL